MRRAGGRVLVPEGWSRAVVMRGPDGPARGGPGRPKSAAGDRDTYYTPPDGVTLKSKCEVNKYSRRDPKSTRALGISFSRPNPKMCLPRGSSRRERPRPRPRPGRGEGKRWAREGREETGEGCAGIRLPFASAPKTKHAKGTGARDATGKLLSPNATSRGMGAFLRETLRGRRPSGKSTALKPLSHAACQRAAVDADRFNAWKSGGLLEGAVAKVLRRAGNVGKSIRGSSLVLQVEQALGVGSGALRGHGSDIRDIAKAKQPKAR